MPGKKSSQIGELALIEQIRSRQTSRRPRPHIALGIGDDCALLDPPRGHQIAVTTDFLLETKHFRRDWHPPESAGHRALARGLSDLAAMGAKPIAAFLSLALPPEMLTSRKGRAWVERFFRGLQTLGDRFNVPLAGGDTAESPNALVLADIVLIGSTPRGKALRRSAGRPGDILYVTGALGGAAAELELLSEGKKQKKNPPHPQLYPEPRIAVGLALVRRSIAHAAIDLSDGLSTDLAHLCRESNLAAEIDEAALPLHPLALTTPHGSPRSRESILHLALNGGEDYELLFAASPWTKVPRSIAGTRITQIGRLREGEGVTLIARNDRRSNLKPGGWEHFSSR